MMAEAARAGFLTAHDARDYELHPLLREFLRKKAPLLDQRDRQLVIDGTLKALIATQRWDDAFVVIVDCDVPHALPTLFEAALDFPSHERGAWAARQSADDTAVRDEVLSLIGRGA